jgi:hypothetical protein
MNTMMTNIVRFDPVLETGNQRRSKSAKVLEYDVFDRAWFLMTTNDIGEI